MTLTAGTDIELILVNFFVYVGSAGTIYFGLGALFTGLGVDNLWITRRSRGRTTELKGVTWMAISFAAAVFLSILAQENGPVALLFFAIICWVGWIGFQAYLSTRTSLRVATLSEPKKGGILLGIGSFVLLLIGLAIIAVEALAALYLIPNDIFGLGTMLNGMFSNATQNILDQYQFLLIAYAMLGIFAIVMLLAFLRYSGRGAALNIALLTIFISIYAGYFLFNVMRRTDVSGFGIGDVLMSLFFLVYAMSGIGSTLIEAVEETRIRTRDFAPLLTFFLASGYFFVDSIISVASDSNTLIWSWFHLGGFLSDPRFLFLFKDVSKLIAFPLVAIFTAVYYLRVERAERIVHKAKEKGKALKPEEVDSDVAEEIEEEEKKPKSPDRYSTPEPERDSRRLQVDSSRRLGAPKRYGEDDED